LWVVTREKEEDLARGNGKKSIVRRHGAHRGKTQEFYHGVSRRKNTEEHGGRRRGKSIARRHGAHRGKRNNTGYCNFFIT